MQTWMIVVGALALPFVMVMIALGIGETVDLRRRHPKAPGILSIICGLFYVLGSWVVVYFFLQKEFPVWMLVTGIVWILTGCVQLFQVRGQQRVNTISTLSEKGSINDNR